MSCINKEKFERLSFEGLEFEGQMQISKRCKNEDCKDKSQCLRRTSPKDLGSHRPVKNDLPFKGNNQVVLSSSHAPEKARFFLEDYNPYLIFC